MNKAGLLLPLLICFLLLIAAPARSQPGASTEDLAKQTQNPVADLISVPLQSN